MDLLSPIEFPPHEFELVRPVEWKEIEIKESEVAKNGPLYRR